MRGCLSLLVKLFGFFLILSLVISGLGVFGLAIAVFAFTLSYYSPNYRNWLNNQPGYVYRLSKIPGLSSSSPITLTIATTGYLLLFSVLSFLMLARTPKLGGGMVVYPILGVIGIILLYGWGIRGWGFSSSEYKNTSFPFRAVVYPK